MHGDIDKEFDAFMKGEKPQDDPNGLFEDDENDKNMNFEKMNSLADIDDLDDYLFEDEREKNHVRDAEDEKYYKYADMIKNGKINENFN